MTASPVSVLPLGVGPAQIQTILNTIEEGVQLWDRRGKLIFANPASAALFGPHPIDLVGTPWQAWSANCLDEHEQSCREADFPLARVLDHQESAARGLYHWLDSEGARRWVRWNAFLWTNPVTGIADGAVSSTVDVTTLVEQEKAMQRQAYYDALTGLPNRSLLSDRLDVALARARRNHEMLAVCLIDLDGFKAINDVLGHKAGDELLQEVARRLQANLRAEDTAARLGGDEFAVLIGGFKEFPPCEQVLQRLCESIAEACEVAGQSVRVSASIGVTLFPGDAGDPDQLLRHADQAMYKAKQGGKNRFCIFDPTLESRARANQGLLRKISQGLEKREFVLHYQPIVDCRKGTVVGVEALIRWQHPILGSRLPGEFLPLIAQEDLLIAIGEWVLEESLAQQQTLRRAGFDLTVSVNIPARQLLRSQLLTQVSALAAHYPDARVDALQFEIVETAALEDVRLVAEIINQGHALGLRFALDDFGTGFSSLVHLKRLAVDVLKIDQAFVHEMLVDPGDLAIAESIIGLAGAFQRQVVAEGVENIEQVLMLLDLGCDVMQGYGLARPMPAERLLDWLREFRPDPRWQAVRSGYPSHTDFDLLLMEVAHRHWLDQVHNGLLGEGECPSLAFADCRLTRWCHTARHSLHHAGKGQTGRLEMLHRQVHEVAQAFAASVQADTPEQWEKLTRLDTLHDELMNCLRELRLQESTDNERGRPGFPV